MFILTQKKVSSKYFIFADFLSFILKKHTHTMAMPAFKCPYLAQFTLKQIRASASNIFNTGAQSCPIFGQLIRRMSTTLNMDEIKAVHENIVGMSTVNKIKIPTSTGESKNQICLCWNNLLSFFFL